VLEFVAVAQPRGGDHQDLLPHVEAGLSAPKPDVGESRRRGEELLITRIPDNIGCKGRQYGRAPASRPAPPAVQVVPHDLAAYDTPLQRPDSLEVPA